ncbi:hypothetical protein O4J56_00390 [Nocardiopsis sp. RSe5-2]|uniref:Uncharacterized protein n=1 Tax=Nocardiopsis endophytica TaxID=3018445 RepID=A0ABT4TWL2_9ACTN|nr:hypothetical protein [Nocardiopsis endophytica]MDA2809087.1 hypothetical protein [Nocardiopsis endophytica]
MVGNTLCAAPACDRRAPRPEAGPRLCARCRDHIAADLRRLPSLYAESEHALAPAPWMLTERVSGGRPGGRAVDEALLAARSDMMAVLASWAGLVADRTPAVRRPPREAGALVRFLLRHLSVLLESGLGADLAAEVAAVGERMRGALAGPGALRRVLGPCVHPGCDAQVSVAGADGERVRPADVRCANGHAWPPHEWLSLAVRLNRADVSHAPKTPGKND